MYRAEVWGWKQYETVKRCQNKYIKWLLGLNWDTLRYIVREETKLQAMKTETGKRTNSKKKSKRIIVSCYRSWNFKTACNKLYCRNKKPHGNGAITDREGRRNQLDKKN